MNSENKGKTDINDNRARIAVIEDTQYATYYDKFLSENNFIVLPYTELDNFQKRAVKEKFDLVITDSSSVELTGDVFVNLLRSRETNKSTPVILCTKYLDPGVKKAMTDFPEVFYMEKPFQKKEMVNTINSILKKNQEKVKIDVRFINPVLTATIDTLKELGVNITAGKAYAKKENETSGDVSGVVRVYSPGFDGSISISFPQDCFLSIVSAMAGEEYQELTDETRDAAAELINIIFGKAANVLNDAGMKLESAVPTMMTGRNHTVLYRKNIPVIAIPFSCEFGKFKIEIGAQ